MLEETQDKPEEKRYKFKEFSFLQGLRQLETNLDPFGHRDTNQTQIPTKRLQTLLGQSLRWKADFHHECLLGKPVSEQDRLVEKSISRVLGINKSNSLKNIVQLTFQWRAQGSQHDQAALGLESLVELLFASKVVIDSEGKPQEFDCAPEILTLLLALRKDSQQSPGSVASLPISKHLINRLMSRRSVNSTERQQFSADDRRMWSKLAENHGAAFDSDFHKSIPSK